MEISKVIDGRRYDTRTATLLLDHCSNRGSFSYIYEGLYRKRNGEYFIAGEGGPMSKYSKMVGMNEWTGGGRITPVSLDRAKKFISNYGNVDDFDRIFGSSVDEDSELFSFDLPSNLRAKLRDLVAKGAFPTMSSAIIACISSYNSFDLH